MTEPEPKLEADYSDVEIRRLKRLILAFLEDPDYELRDDHIRAELRKLKAEDEGFVAYDDKPHEHP